MAIDLLYNRDYGKSIEVLSDWKYRYPDHPAWSLWKALDLWWPILIDLENTSNDNAFLVASWEVIEHCNQLLYSNENDLDARLIRSVMYGLIARHHSNRYNWYRSILNARRALRDFFQIKETHPGIPDLNFGIGIYRYFAAYFVEEFPLVRPIGWMLPRGDREEGLFQLNQAAENSIFLQPESIYFLGHIYLHYENEAGLALDHLSHLYQKYPENTFYRRLYIHSQYSLRMMSETEMRIIESLEYYKHVNNHETQTMREDLLTLKGLIHYQQFQYEKAKSEFLKAIQVAETLEPFEERTNMLTSLYHLGEMSIREGQREEARNYFGRAASSNSDYSYARRSREAMVKHQLQ